LLRTEKKRRTVTATADIATIGSKILGNSGLGGTFPLVKGKELFSINEKLLYFIVSVTSKLNVFAADTFLPLSIE
jgi:hypothetical protein